MSQYEDNHDQQPDIPALREAAERGRAASKERDEAIRRLALVEAGVDSKAPVGKLFIDAYKGPLEEEAIKAAWAEVAPTAAAPPPPPSEEPMPPTPTGEQLEETDARRLLTSGGAGDTPNEQPDPDPIEAGYTEFHQRMKQGEGRDVAAGSVFAHLFEAAGKGDERALWNGWSAEDLAQGRR